MKCGLDELLAKYNNDYNQAVAVPPTDPTDACCKLHDLALGTVRTEHKTDKASLSRQPPQAGGQRINAHHGVLAVRASQLVIRALIGMLGMRRGSALGKQASQLASVERPRPGSAQPLPCLPLS